MKLIVLSFLLIISVLGFSQKAAEPQYINALIGFYNLENMYDTIDDPKIDDQEFLPNSAKKYNTFAYNRKLNNMASVIKGMGLAENPDGLALLGVVEVENATVLKDLAATDSLKDRNYQYVHFNSPDARGIDVGLLYQPKYFTVLSARPHHVELPDKHPTRDILVVQGDLVGDTVYVLVNHWPSRRGGSNNFDLNNKEKAYNRNTRVTVDRVSGVTRQGGVELNENEGLVAEGTDLSSPAREAAAKACVAVMDSINALHPNAKIIIMGDLNDDPTNTSVAKVINAKENAADVAPKGMYNALQKFFKKGYGSLAYNGKWNLFDQQMFSYSFLDQQQLNGWFFYSAHIYARDYLINQKGDYKGYPKRSWIGNYWNGGYSDHFPVYSILVRALPAQ
jgi:predicted extracellular nuclease